MAFMKQLSPGKTVLPFVLVDSGGKHYALTQRRRTSKTSIALSVALALVFVIAVYTTYRVSPCYIGWLWHYHNRCVVGVAHPWAATPYDKELSERAGASAPKIAVAMVVDDFMHPDVRNLTIRNKQRYARTWGHDLFIPSKEELSTMAGKHPVAWVKFPLIKKILKTHDYVFVIDADAVILREDISLRKAADTMGSASLLISDDVNGPNSGGKFCDDASVVLSSRTERC